MLKIGIKYGQVYLQKYEYTLQGFLIDEDEFEVTPALTRTFQIYETETRIKKRKQNSLLKKFKSLFE